MDEEDWREIDGYSLYLINPYGVVWSKQWNRAIKHSAHIKPRVMLLSDNWRRKSFQVEDLLNEAFGEDGE